MATPKEIFEVKIPATLEEKAATVSAINAVYEFNITGGNGGVWSINLKDGKREVSGGSTGSADCTITMSDTDFISLIDGELNSQMAFMTGKLKVAGNMGLALKLGTILG